MDFVHDQLTTGRKMRVLTVIDISLRFSPAIDPRFSRRVNPGEGLQPSRLSGDDPSRSGHRLRVARSRSI